MSLSGNALRLTVFLSQDDKFGHHPLYTEIVSRARAAGLAGATVLRGFEGFGASSHLHTSRLLSLSDDLPALVVIIDRPDPILDFLPQVRELTTGLVTLEEVEVVSFADGVQTRQGEHHGADG
jgi:PII-like signaling protein